MQYLKGRFCFWIFKKLNLVNNINSAFQSIKTKYGITDTQLATFNRENLSSANKLPTTGCN